MNAIRMIAACMTRQLVDAVTMVDLIALGANHLNLGYEMAERGPRLAAPDHDEPLEIP